MKGQLLAGLCLGAVLGVCSSLAVYQFTGGSRAVARVPLAPMVNPAEGEPIDLPADPVLRGRVLLDFVLKDEANPDGLLAVMNELELAFAGPIEVDPAQWDNQRTALACASTYLVYEREGKIKLPEATRDALLNWILTGLTHPRDLVRGCSLNLIDEIKLDARAIVYQQALGDESEHVRGIAQRLLNAQ